jgi:hypothetical protein
MNPRERFESLQDTLLAWSTGWQRDIWTAMPGVIDSYDPTTQTCVVNVPVQIMMKLGNDTPQPVSIPPLLDVPVFFPGGGGFTLTFPVVKGDECLVVFASRCIDAWWQSGATGATPTSGVPPFFRMHDLSDGFAFIGFRSQPRMLSPSASTTATELRSDDGTASLHIETGKITVSATTVEVNATTANVNAAAINLSHGGTMFKLIKDTLITLYNAHTHTSAAPGVQTAPPTVPLTAAVATTIVQAE